MRPDNGKMLLLMSAQLLTLGVNAVLCDLSERVKETGQVQLCVPTREGG